MKHRFIRIIGVTLLSIGAMGCAATADPGQQAQMDQALRTAQEARAAADRAQVTADQAKAMAEQANAAAEDNSKKVDRAFTKSQQK